MFIRTFLFVCIVGLVTCQASLAEASKWKIDPAHSDARFSVKHMMVSNVSGDFGKISGSAMYDGVNFDKASVHATIPVDEITTREPKRDEHLKSPEFFDVAKYPTIDFQSKKIEMLDNGEFKMIGDLTMHGVTKQVVLTGEKPGKPIKDPSGKLRIGASASTKLNRKDFGISFNKTLDNGGAMVGDDVGITIDVELVPGS